jgi:hypothetical protein
MSHLFQRRGSPLQSEFDEARVVLHRLKACDAETRFAVGAGVHLANADFIRRFAGLESFRRIPAEEQKRFCSELSDLEFRLRSHKLGMAVGVGLYKIWLTDVLARRSNIAEMLGQELTELSRRASAA